MKDYVNKPYGIDIRYKKSFRGIRNPQYNKWVSFKRYKTINARETRLFELEAEASQEFEYRRTPSAADRAHDHFAGTSLPALSVAALSGASMGLGVGAEPH